MNDKSASHVTQAADLTKIPVVPIRQAEACAQEAAKPDIRASNENANEDTVHLMSEHYQNEYTQREIERLIRLDEYHQYMRRLFWAMAVAGGLLFMVTSCFLFQQRRSRQRLIVLNRELNRSRNQLHATLEAVPDFLFKLDCDGRYLDCYAHDQLLLAIPRDRLIGKTIAEVLPPDAAAICMQGIQEATSRGKSSGLQYRLNLPDGMRWFELSIARKQTEVGRDSVFIGLARDITERKSMEETLFRERATLQAFFRSLPALAWMKDQDGRILACNPVFEQLYGASAADIVGKMDADFVDAERAAFFRQKDKEAMEASEPIIFEEPVIFACNGRHAIVETVKTPVQDADGKVIGVMGIAHDITERKRVGEALAAHEREFRTLVDNLPDLIIRYDRNCQRVFVNRALSVVSGQAFDQLVGTSPAESEAYEPETKQHLLQAIRKTFDSAERQEVSIEQGGRDFTLAIVPERNSEGNVITALAIARDVTAIRSVERHMARFMANASAFVFTFRCMPDGCCSFPFASPGIELLFGITPDAVRDDMAALHSQIHPEDTPRIEKTIAESARLLTPFQMEFRVSRPDRPDRWVESRGVPEVAAGGSIVWQGVMLDITERKRLEAALKESEALHRYNSSLLQSIFESSRSVSIYALDREYRYLAFNNKCRDNARRKWHADITIGKCMLDVVDTEGHREFCRREFDQVLTGRSFSLESKEPVTSDGVTLYEHNENYGSPIRNDDGEIIGLTIFAFDITERKRLEATLQESEARYRYNSGLLQSIFDSPYSVSVYAFDQDYRLLAFNEKFRGAAKRLWNADIAVGMSMLDVIDTEEHRRFFRQGADQVLAGHSYMLESKEAVIEDGITAYEYHENYGSPIYNDKSEIIGMTVFAINISERHKLVAALRENERKFRTLVENIPDLVARYDRDCRRILVNSVVARTFGRSTDDLIGSTPADGQIYAPELSERLIKTIHQAFDAGALQYDSFQYADHEYSMLVVPEIGDTGEVETVLCISRDVTAIRAIERSMSRFMVNAAAFVFTFRRLVDGRCSYPFASPGIKALFGVEPDDVRDDMAPLLSQIHPVDASRVEEAIAESARSLKPLHIEFRVLRPEQPERWIENRSVPETAADGSIVWQGVMLDITERKQAEKALLAKEKALAEAQRIAHVGSWELDHVEHTLTWSEEAFDIFEVDPALHGISQKAFAEAIHPEDREQVNLAFARLLTTMEPYAIEYRLLMQDGRTKHVFERCETHHDASGRPMRSLGTVQDISDRKNMELALIRSEREFRTLAENSPDYIVRYDRSGRIRYANPQLAELGGFSAERATDKPIGAYLPTEDIRSAYLAAYSLVLQTGDSYEIEMATDALGETTTYFQLRFVPEHDEFGNTRGVLAIGHDISDLKYKERELEESRDLLRKLSAHLDSAREDERKHIAREIHDHLGQLLTAQRLGISTMKYKYGIGNPELNEYCQHLLNVTDVTIQSVRDMATLLRPSSLDMGIIPALEWLSNDFHKRSGIACEFCSDSQSLDIDEQHSLAIFRIVQESLTNVMRHAEAQEVCVSLESLSSGLRLTIRDDGKGFDPDSLSVGTFGLLGIRERALIIGGKVQLLSSPGNGTLVEVLMPLQEAKAAVHR